MIGPSRLANKNVVDRLGNIAFEYGDKRIVTFPFFTLPTPPSSLPPPPFPLYPPNLCPLPSLFFPEMGVRGYHPGISFRIYIAVCEEF